MDDFPGLLLMISGALAGVTTMAGLFWAAVMDGRDEREFRRLQAR